MLSPWQCVNYMKRWWERYFRDWMSGNFSASSISKSHFMPHNCRSNVQDAQISFNTQNVISLVKSSFAFHVTSLELLRFQSRPPAIMKAIILDSDHVRIQIWPTMRHSSLKENGLGWKTRKLPCLGSGGRALAFQLCWRKIAAELSVFLDSSSHVWAEVLPDCLGMGQDRLCVSLITILRIDYYSSGLVSRRVSKTLGCTEWCCSVCVAVGRCR